MANLHDIYTKAVNAGVLSSDVSEERFSSMLQNDDERKAYYDYVKSNRPNFYSSDFDTFSKNAAALFADTTTQPAASAASAQEQPTNPSVAANPAPTTEAEYQANLQKQWEGEPTLEELNNSFDDNAKQRLQMQMRMDAMQRGVNEMQQRVNNAPDAKVSLSPSKDQIANAMENIDQQRMPEIRKHTIAQNMLNETADALGEAQRTDRENWMAQGQGMTPTQQSYLANSYKMNPYLDAANRILFGAEVRMKDAKRQNGISAKNIGSGLVSFAGDAGRHFLTKLEGMASFGLSDLNDAVYQRDVLKKVADADAFDDPSKVLSKEENVLYDAIITNIAVEIAREKDTSRWSKAGQITADMIPFIEDIMLGNALFKGFGDAGRKAITKGVEKHVKNKLGKWLLTNVGDVAMSAGESAATAAILPHTYANMLNNSVQVNQDKLGMDGDFRMKLGGVDEQNMGQSFGQAYGDQFLELFTETGGNFRLLGRALVDNPVGKKILKTPLGNVLKRFEKAEGGVGSRLASMTMYHGVVGEWLEELEGAIYKGELKDFFTADTQLPMLLSFAVPASLTGGLNAAQQSIFENKYKKAGQSIDRLINQSNYDGSDKNTLKGQMLATLYQTDLEDLPKTIGMFVEQVYPEQYRDLMNGGKEKGNPAAELAYAFKEYLSSGTILTAFDPNKTAEQIADVAAYREQMRNSAKEQIETNANSTYDPITNKTNGYIYHARQAGDEQSDLHIINGNVVTTTGADGRLIIDKVSSDEKLTVVDAEGHVTLVAPDELELIEAPIAAYEAKAAYMDRANQIESIKPGDSVVVNGESSIIKGKTDEGIVVDVMGTDGQAVEQTIPFETVLRDMTLIKSEDQKPVVITNGSTIRVQGLDNGNGTYSVTTTNGITNVLNQAQMQEMGLRIEDLQQEDAPQNETDTFVLPDGTTKQLKREDGFWSEIDDPSTMYTPTELENMGWTKAEQQVQEPQADDNTDAPQANVPSYPVDQETGNPAWGQMDVEQSAAALVEVYQGDKQSAKGYADDMLKEAQKMQSKLAKQQSHSLNLQQRIQEDNAIKAQRDAINAEVNKWQNIKLAIASIKTEAERQAEEEQRQKMMQAREERSRTEEGAKTNTSMAERYAAAPKIIGNEGTITLPDGRELKGRYILTTPDAATASHDARSNFAMSSGYPVTEDGQSINDRDYTNDPEEQQKVIGIATNYNGNAIKNMPVVSDEGLVYNGNGRWMAGQLAAANGTDGAYTQSLMNNAGQFGFTAEQVQSIPNARVAFQLDERLPYNTSSLAIFNEQETQTQSNTGKAAAYARKLTPQAISDIIDAISGFNTRDAFFNDSKAPFELINRLIADGIISEREKAEMVDGDKLSALGRERLENIMLGTVFSNETIRLMGDDAGLKNSILRALPQIIDNKSLGEYSLEQDINDAIRLLYEVRNSKMPFRAFVSQTVIAEDGQVRTAADNYSPFQLLLAEEMTDGGVDAFRDVLTSYNTEAKQVQGGQVDIFGGLTSTDELKQLVLNSYGKKESTNEGANTGSETGSAAPSPQQSNGQVEQTETIEDVTVEDPIYIEASQKLKNLIGEDAYNKLEQDFAKNYRESTIAAHKGRADEIVDKGEGEFDYGDSVYDWNYFGFLLYKNNNTGKLHLDIKEKYDGKQGYNPYITRNKETNNKEELRKEMYDTIDRQAQYGSVELPYSYILEQINKAENALGKSPATPTEGAAEEQHKEGDVVARTKQDGEITKTKFTRYIKTRKGAIKPLFVGGKIIDASIIDLSNDQDTEIPNTIANAEYIQVTELRTSKTGSAATILIKEKGIPGFTEMEVKLLTDNLDAVVDNPILNEARQQSETVQQAAAEAEAEQAALENSPKIQGMDYTVAEVEDMTGRMVRNILDENGYEGVEIVGVKVIGSRTRNEARDDSDLDVLVEYKGDATEDGLFNLINDENKIVLDGVEVDVNPITRGKSGTIEQFMKRSDAYLAEQKAAQAKSESNTYGSKNTLVTNERYEELKSRMRKKLTGQLNMGVDPEILAIGTEMAVYHIEAGAHKFIDFAQRMIADLGDTIRPYLKAFYNGARDLPEMVAHKNKMDLYNVVSDFDVDAITIEQEQPQQQTKQENPILQSYRQIKEQYPDAAVLFRAGDFYEIYEEDADELSKILNITVTNRNGMRMAGFPFHALDTYLPKIVRAGKRVAIADGIVIPIEPKKQPKFKEDDIVYYPYNNGLARLGISKVNSDGTYNLNGDAANLDVNLINIPEDKLMTANDSDKLRDFFIKQFSDHLAETKIDKVFAKDLLSSVEKEIDKLKYDVWKNNGGTDVQLVEAIRLNAYYEAISNYINPSQDNNSAPKNAENGAEILNNEEKSVSLQPGPKLDKSDYRSYMTPESREMLKDDKLEHPELGFIPQASKDGVKIPAEVLLQEPRIAEAQEKVDSRGKEQLIVSDQEKAELAMRLFDDKHGSAVMVEKNGKQKINKINGEEDFSGEVDRGKHACIVIGRPAGGKSSVFANPLSAKYHARIIDSDIVKPWLNGFDGGFGAGYVQKASSDIAERALDEAVTRGENIIIPRIGGGSVIDLAVKLKQAGYAVDLYYNEVSQESSIMRAAARFAETGRYLSIGYLTSIKDKPQRTFNNFANSTIGEIKNERPELFKLSGHDDAGSGRRDGVGGLDESQQRSSDSEHLFVHAEWETNEVAFGEEPRLVWSSDSTEPVPGTQSKREKPKTTDTIGTITKSKDTRDGSDIWLVNTSDRVSAEEFKDLKKRAKDNNGYWSSFSKNKGFLFKSEEDANNFNNITEDERTTDETAANTRAIGDEGTACEREVETAISDADEQGRAVEAEVANPIITHIDETVDKANEQLMLLGHYEAADDANELGLSKSAERKAVKNVTRVAKQLAKDLGVDANVKVTANIAPAGGDVSFRIPLQDGNELYVTIPIVINGRYGEYTREDWESYNSDWGYNDLIIPQLTGTNWYNASKFMYRIEHTNNEEHNRYEPNEYITTQTTYDNFLNAIRKLCRPYLPKDNVPAPAEYETLGEYAKRVAQDQEQKKQQREQSKAERKKDKNAIQDNQLMGDLFADVVEDVKQAQQDQVQEQLDEHQDQVVAQMEEVEPNKPQNNEPSNTRVQTPNGGVRSGNRQEVQQNEPSGVDRDNSESVRNDGAGSGTMAAVNGAEQLPVNRNQHNFRNGRGKSLAPTTPKARFDANIAAIRLMRELRDSNKRPTKAQQQVLAQYSGWGGLGTFFNRYGSAEYNTLHELFNEEELHDAELSINTAYYTPTYIIDNLWDIVGKMGFKGGDILEGSAGIGNILAQMPSSISGSSAIQAVELDQTTGGILKLLYPDAKVDIEGFQDVDIRPRSKDLVVTNVPFDSQLKLFDEKNKDISDRFGLIHNFCIAKNIRALREGGLGVFITTSGTLDKNRDLFQWLSEHEDTDVIGAFRLNNATFDGAPVTSDIIVVRKRINKQRSPQAIDVSSVTTERFVEYDTNPHTYYDNRSEAQKKKDTKRIAITYNKYFADHPENMGGEMKANYEMGDTFRPEGIGLHPVDGKNQDKLLKKWVASFEEQEQAERPAKVLSQSEEVKGEKVGALVVNSKGEICQVEVEDEKMVAKPIDTTNTKVAGRSKAEVLKDFHAVRDALDAVLEYQTKNEGDEGLKPLLSKLNAAYDSFHRKYGNFHANTRLSWLRNDIDFSSVAETEVYRTKEDANGRKTATVSKADVMSKRVLMNKAEVKVDNVRDGIIMSIRENGWVNTGYIAGLLGRSTEDVAREMYDSGLVFRDPVTDAPVVKYEYLSGNILDKLDIARANNDNGQFDDNIRELERVCPATIPSHLISVSFGATWLDPIYYAEYVSEKTGIPAQHIHVVKVGSKWDIDFSQGEGTATNQSNGVHSEKLHVTIPVSKLLQAAINNQSVSVSKTEKVNGETHTEYDKDATQVCSTRIDQYKDEFQQWFRDKMKADTERSAAVEDTYNRSFNQYVPMRVSKEFIPEHFDGATESIKLNDWQSQAAVRATMQPIMLAHEVGSGKTFTMITAAMEMRRLGTAKKPMIVVQNATVKQFVSEAHRLYPRAKVLSITDKDTGVDGRMAFYRKIKYNDWDMIIIPQSVFNKIPESIERKEQYIQEKIDEKRRVVELMQLEKLKAAEGDYAEKRALDMKIKGLEKEIEKMQEDFEAEREARLLASIAVAPKTAKQLDKERKKSAEDKAKMIEKAKRQLSRKTDNIESFDDMDIDALFIDEAHEYKRLGFESMTGWGIKGIDKASSGRAVSLWCKMQTIFDRTSHKNVVFATGTPISNTAAEVWTFMKYLIPKEDMQKHHIYYFDDFVHNFGKIIQRPEFKTDGKFKEVTRFAEYNNVPELVRLWTSCSDTVLSPEKLREMQPDTEAGGKNAQDIFLPQTRTLRSVMKWVREQLEAFDKMSGQEKKEHTDIPLRMYGIASAAAIDPRLVVDAPDEPNSKTNAAVKEILRALEDSKPYNGTVAIFSDKFRNSSTGFNLFEDIRQKLIDAGVPASQIAVISSQNKDQKQKIFDKVNAGEIRVILGSTQKLGVGVNIQERLFEEIHLDAPNRPMDYQQRVGRIIRQGNLHKEWGIPVRLIRFGVEDSLDVTAYQRLKTKTSFSDTVMKFANDMNLNSQVIDGQTNRSMEEDDDAGQFDNMIAQISGSEYAMLVSDAERKLRKLQAEKKQFEDNQVWLEKANRMAKIHLSNYSDYKAKLEKGLKALRDYFPDGKVTTVKVAGKTITSDKVAEETYKRLNAQIEVAIQKAMLTSEDRTIASFDFELDGMKGTIDVTARSEKDYRGGYTTSITRRAIHMTIPSIGIDFVPTRKPSVKTSIEHIIDDIVPGTTFEKEIKDEAYAIEKLQSDIASYEQKSKETFTKDDELRKLDQNIKELTAKMKEEMAAKEAKYAEMDAEVETINVDAEKIDLSEDEDTDDAEMQISNEDYSEYSQLVNDAIDEALDNAGIDVVRVEEPTEDAGAEYMAAVDNMKHGINALKKIANGEEVVYDAMRRNDLAQFGGGSEIAFYFGNIGDPEKDFKKGYGISHMAAKHGSDTILKAIDIIANGEIVRYVPGNKTVILTDGEYDIVLALTRFGEKETWLFTGWKRNEKTDGISEVSTQSDPTQTNPTFSREDLGAAISDAKVQNLFETSKFLGEKMQNFSEMGGNAEFSIRQEPAPKKTGIGYKVFYRGKDGKLYPPMVANPNGEATPVGVWLNADAAPIAGESKTGRPQVKAGGKGTQGGSGTLAYRPGWHLGEIPYALQFNRKDAQGNKTLFPKDFVWAEVEYAADNDYQEEAMKEGTNAAGKFQHSLAGLKRVPENGFYRYRTNPNPDTDPWIITGAMKVNRVLTDAEVDEIVRQAGREPQQREYFRTPNGVVYGWAKDGKIYLTEDGLNPNTKIHEYTHLWAKAMQQRNQEGWQSVVDNFKGTPMWDEVVNDPNYQNLQSDDDICSEALARFSGSRGEERMQEIADEMQYEAKESGLISKVSKVAALLQRVKKALSDFWKWVSQDLFKIKKFTSPEEVADRVLFDLVDGASIVQSMGINQETDAAEMRIEDPARDKFVRDWNDAHPHPQYYMGEGLDHYRMRLDKWTEEYKIFQEQFKARVWETQTPAPAPTYSSVVAPMATNERPKPEGETPREYAARLKAWFDLKQDEQLTADYVGEINRQADAAAKHIKINGLKRAWLDAAKPIEDFQDWMVARGAKINGDSNAYQDTFLATGRVSTTSEALTRDLIRPLAQQIGKIIAVDKETDKSRLADIALEWRNMDVKGSGAPKIDGKQLTPREIIGVYAQAKDCEEAEQKGLPDRGAAGFVKNLGVTYKEVIDAVESVIPADELNALWDLIRKSTKFALDYDFQSGRITEETYKEFSNREYYVPQRGWRERDMSGIVSEYEPVGKLGNDPYNAALVKARGRQTLASDPFPYIMSIDASSIISSENNKIKQQFLQFCLDNEELGLKTGAFRIKKFWLMHMLDKDGNVMKDENGQPMYEVSYSAPSEDDLKHDKGVQDKIRAIRRDLSKVKKAYEQNKGKIGPQLEQAYEAKIVKLEKDIEDLENTMRIAWTVPNSAIEQRTKDEKKQHEVVVLKDGERYIIELKDEKLANAINKKFKQHQEELFNTASKMRNATRFLSAMLTQYNPEFAASNFARDYQVALATLMAEHPELVKPFIKNFAACQPAVWQYAWNDKVRDRENFADTEMGQYLKEYFESGAPTGFSYMKDLNTLRDDFDKLITEKDWQRGMRGAIGVFSMLTEVSETAVRFAGYVSARQSGMSINDAAYLSKELTTNFDRAGEVADSGWMSWFSFFRATLNGNIKFLKALKKMPLAYSIIAVSYFAMGILNQLLNPNDPDDEVWASDFVRESNFVFGKIRIPTAHFLRMFFGAGVNAAMWLQGNKSFGHSVYDTSTFVTNEMLPNYLNIVGNATEWNSRKGQVDFTWEGLLQGLMPSPAAPVADVFFNRDFMGATINREPFTKGESDTKDILLSKDKTLPVYKWLTQAVYETMGGNMKTKYKSDDPAWRSWLFDNSASSVEHIVEGYIPAGADMFVTLGEAIYDAATGTPTSPDKWPFVRKFYNAYTPERAYNQQYYLLNSRVSDFEKNLKDYQKNDRDRYFEVRRSPLYQSYRDAQRLVDKRKENPTTEDVKRLMEVNKQWTKYE